MDHCHRTDYMYVGLYRHDNSITTPIGGGLIDAIDDYVGPMLSPCIVSPTLGLGLGGAAL